MSAGHIVSQLNQWSLWAEINPDTCPCGGSGWLVSDFDTVHRCGLHEGPHPEDDSAPHDPHRMLRLRRVAYRTFMEASGLGAQEFCTACVTLMGREARDPQEWVEAADRVVGEILTHAREDSAQAQGFSCDLERRWHNEALRERAERG